MRIPLSKAYRAFPELDSFDDATCERYVKVANQQFGASKSGWIALGLAIAFFGSCVGSLLVSNVCDWAEDSTRSWRFDPSFIAGGVFLLVVLFVAFTPVLLLRDRWLKRAILEKLRMARCPTCSYSLLGLTVKDGAVMCPECATPFVLKDRGLTEEDMIAQAVS